MTGSLEPDAGKMRASHEDRDEVVERLRDAAGDGRLAPEELDQRLELALTARTQGELEVLVQDLPAAVRTDRPAAKDLVRLHANMGNVERTGAWAVPRRLEAEVRMGNAVIDLTEAVVAHPVLDMEVEVSHGNLRLIVPPEVAVEVDEVSVHAGNVKRRRSKGGDGTVRLRVNVSGTVRHGNVIVRGPRRTFLEWLLRRPAGSR
ncbi:MULTISPECIES: DUF1707 SHOCT-like domain-containing protein [Actinomadura]|uniref:DUF1707 domain-containing protein n=1 Tax=Actinomadura yumaensis TaxID=111807 RepID=A0ABW2CQY8_9ACTN|nr:DUF1707 domain-containing protein [Actinomadura sp. J1-007]